MFERYSEQARRLIFMALWSTRRRSGAYIEPGDLLHALIRQDRGEFPVISGRMFPGAPPEDDSAERPQPFFAETVAADLLREIHEDPNLLSAETLDETREAIPPVDVPVSASLKKVLASVAKAHEDDTKTIEPLDLLAGIVEDHESRLAQLLRTHGITRQAVDAALNPES